MSGAVLRAIRLEQTQHSELVELSMLVGDRNLCFGVNQFFKIGHSPMQAADALRRLADDIDSESKKMSVNSNKPVIPKGSRS